MKLDELILRARQWTGRGLADGKPYCIEPDFEIDPEDAASILAHAILDILGEAQPCSFEAPVSEPGMVSILDGSDDPQPAYQFTPSEARWFAAELLRAADEAEGG